MEGRGLGMKKLHILHPHHETIVSELPGIDEVELSKHPMSLDA